MLRQEDTKDTPTRMYLWRRGVLYGISELTPDGWVIHDPPPSGEDLPELQPVEGAGVSPGVDVPEEGHGPSRVSDIGLGGGPAVLPLIVVVAGRAVERPQHHAGTGQDQLHPILPSLSTICSRF
jgi:hypothetical protein